MKRKLGVIGQTFFYVDTWIKPEDSENLAKIQKSRGANILNLFVCLFCV